MDVAKPKPGTPGDRSHAAAEKLRALRERASAALADHRRRVEQIEAELSLRIQQLSDEFEAGSVDAVQRAAASQSEEITALRRQVEEGRAKHEKFIEQLAAARRQLEALQTQPCPACQDSANLLAAANDEARILRERLDVATRQHSEDQERQAKFTAQLADARKAIADLQNESGDQRSRLQRELQDAVEGLASAEERLAASSRDAEILHAECEAVQQRADQLEADLAAGEAERAELRQRAESLAAQLKKAQEDQHVAELTASDHSAERELAERLAAAETECAQAREHAAKFEQEKQTVEQELAESLASQQSLKKSLEAVMADAALLRDKAGAVEQAQSAADETLAEAIAACDEMQAALKAAESESAGLQASLAELEREKQHIEQEKQASDTALAQATARHDELKAALDASQRELKTANELAQAGAAAPELQRLLEQTKGEVAAREAELRQARASLEQAEAKWAAERAAMVPQADLDAVRTERDALAQRIEELEKAAAPTTDAGLHQQQVDDLQRRFEMAVDDLREQKQENSRLREQLAAKPQAAVAEGAVGGVMDWAAQRARLMQQLEEEDGASANEPARRKERATIEETIAATDRLIAEKEQELSDLRAAHIARGNSDVIDRELERLLGADEKVAAERERLAALQAELEEKLRAAELEISLERAKLAREQAALKERLVDIQLATPAAAGADGEGSKRRRWLAALGLGEDGEESPKK